MKNKKWIWENNNDNADEYVQFIDKFNVDCTANVLLNISVDSNYTVWINGSLASFGQYADYPHYKVYDSIDISRFLRNGENKIAVLCWYYGENSQVYLKNKAGLIFGIVQNEKILCESSENTFCRIATDYKSYTCEKITPQLGFNYHYDMSKYDGWNEKDFKGNEGFHKAELVENMPSQLYIRPTKKLILEERANAKMVSQGTFLMKENPRKSVSMQNAGLFFEELETISGQYNHDLLKGEILLKSKENGGIYFIVDLGREECGFLDIELFLKEKTRIDIAYGEHLEDGRVRSAVGERNYCCSYHSKEGWQKYLNTFRRFGLRYLQFFVHSDEIKIMYAGIRSTNYPLSINESVFNNKLRKDIYETSLRTLQLCMHEHYEDCPWREQALYTMDSRNQMLCGYYAFSEYEFAKANLKLIGKGQRGDGLLPLCSPAGTDFPIPFFSIMYLVQMKEYMEYAKDYSLALENYELMKTILTVFLNKMKGNGLVDSFEEPIYWNFYEWAKDLEGFYTDENGAYKQDNRFSYDAVLNGFVSLGLENMAEIARNLDKTEDYHFYLKQKESINKAIFSNFYDKEKGLFKSYLGKNETHYSVLANSLCLLCGACPEEFCQKICSAIVSKEPILLNHTLSMSVFCYDALLKVNKDKYAPYVLKDIDEIYGYMLCKGATTFWETILGESDFGRAGSLCHGWSAIPVFYYSILKQFM